MARPVGSGLISFGLVSIPVKLYAAVGDHGPSFHFLHAKCGSRIRTQRFCPTCNKVLEREEHVRGYEFSKGDYVRFTEEELTALELEANSSIDLTEFVPLESVDPVYIEGTYFLGPEKGGEKAYKLLADAMRQTERVAVAQYVARGKGYLALITPYQDGMVLSTLYYADEIRDITDVPNPKPGITDEEREMGVNLIEEQSADFAPEMYTDNYRMRVLKMVEAKTAGHEVEVAPEPQQRSKIVDLMDALKKSLAEKQGPEKKPAPREVDKAEQIFTYAEFKDQLAELDVAETSLRKSYAGLDRLRKNKNLSWQQMRGKVVALGSALAKDVRNRGGKLKAARIPLTERDWERME